MNSKNVKDIRKQLRGVVQDTLPEVLKQEMFSSIAQEVETKLREVFGARLESINDSIMHQLKNMDDRSKDLQQFMLNQVQADMARKSPKVDLDQTTPDSANLTLPE